MPEFREGEMFSARGVIIITSNSNLTKDGNLVMGAGAAKQLKLIVPGIDKLFGDIIKKSCGSLGRYGLLFRGRYGIAQVKYAFNAPANLPLIEYTMRILTTVANNYPHSKFSINYPGIGYGWLKEKDVKPLLEILPNNVRIWKYKAL